MSNQTFYIDSDTQEYGQDEWEILIDSFMRSGVRIHDDGSMDLKPTYSSSTGITIAKGDAMTGGYFYHQDSAKTISAPTTAGYYNLVVRYTWSTKTCAITTTSATSAYPSPSRIVGTRYDIVIARFRVTSSGGVTNFTDTRTNTSICGCIRARGTSEMDKYFSDIQATFTDMINSLSGSTGLTQVFVGSYPNTIGKCTDTILAGALWINIRDNGIYRYAGPTGAEGYPHKNWIRIGYMRSAYPELGWAMNGDYTFSGTSAVLPLRQNMSGFIDNTDNIGPYTAYRSGSYIIIREAGIYDFTSEIMIKSGAKTNEVYKMSICRDISGSSSIAENYVPGCGGYAVACMHGRRYFEKGQKLYLSVASQTTGSKVVSRNHTYLTVEKICGNTTDYDWIMS